MMTTTTIVLLSRGTKGRKKREGRKSRWDSGGTKGNILIQAFFVNSVVEEEEEDDDDDEEKRESAKELAMGRKAARMSDPRGGVKPEIRRRRRHRCRPKFAVGEMPVGPSAAGGRVGGSAPVEGRWACLSAHPSAADGPTGISPVKI